MKKRILPIVTWIFGWLAWGVTVVGLIAAHWHAALVLGVAWFVGVVAGLGAGSLAVSKWPDLRFATDARIDGHGYVHQPGDFAVPFTLISVLAGVSLPILR